MSISFRISDDIRVIMEQSAAQMRDANSMGAWLIHQALLYPGVVEDVGGVTFDLCDWRRMRLGAAAMRRFDESVPVGMSRSDYARRLIKGGHAILAACPCWICAGYITDPATTLSPDPELRTYITRLDSDEIDIAERVTIAQRRTRISTVSMLVRLGVGQPKVDVPAQRGRRQSQRVTLPVGLLDESMGERAITQQLRDLLHRGIARLRARECCRRMVEWRGGEPMGVFGAEMPMPGTPRYDLIASISGVGPFEMTERAARERERRIAAERGRVT